MASPSAGADAYADHESTAGVGSRWLRGPAGDGPRSESSPCTCRPACHNGKWVPVPTGFQSRDHDQTYQNKCLHTFSALALHAASERLNEYGRTVRTGPPAPSERPPSGFQSTAILKLEPSVVSVMAVQYSETSALARGKSANSRLPPPGASPAYSAFPVIRLIGISLRGLTIGSEQSTIQKSIACWLESNHRMQPLLPLARHTTTSHIFDV